MYVNGDFLTIVSRKSRLALLQSGIVKQRLQNCYPDLKIEIIGISTRGDEILDQSLNKIGGKGLFVKELENYLLENKADMAVHSMKDMPTELPTGLTVAAILNRADPREVFLSNKGLSLIDLPYGAIVGTSSLRRQAQVLAMRADLKIKSLRGNVETRIKKLESGEYDAIILAAAGLERLGLQQWLNVRIPTEQILPAVGQGALGIECRADNKRLQTLLIPLHHQLTANCVSAERSMNQQLNGGCLAPIAGLAKIHKQHLTLQGLVASVDGKIIYTAQHSGYMQQAVEIGIEVARQLKAQGAGKIIEELKYNG